MFRSVVIVGRPNVGKSRLFNRLTRSRISIVHDQPGVTRDVISAEVKDGGYTLMDTGGLGLKEGETSTAAIIAASEKQVGFAIDTASEGVRVAGAKLTRAPPDGADAGSRTSPPARVRALSLGGRLFEETPAGLMAPAPPGLDGAVGLAVWRPYHLRLDTARGWMDLAPSP